MSDSGTTAAPTNIPINTQASEATNDAVSKSSTPQQVEPQKPAKQKFKYKADGQEIEEELDEKELSNRLSLSKAAQKRMQEAAQIKSTMENFIQQLQNDPISVLSNDKLMGQKKFREVAEKFLIAQLEEESMSPEQKTQRDRDRELESYRAQQKKQKEDEQKAEMDKLEQHWSQQFEKTIMTALSTSDLPKNEFTVSRMAALMQKNVDLGLDLEPQQIAQLVREDYLSEQKALIGGLDGEGLIKLFGNDIINKIRKFDLGQLQVKNPAPKKQEQVANEESRDQSRRMNARDFNEQLMKKFNNSSN